MVDAVRVGAVQAPEFIRDVDGAVAWAVTEIEAAASAGASLVCFPEAYLQGYLVDELSARAVALGLGSEDFRAIAARLAGIGPTIVMGMLERDGEQVFNTAVVLADGKLVGRYRKANLLPGEQAFTAGGETPGFEAAGLRFGINICFDTTFPDAADRVRATGANLIVCPSNNMMPRHRAEAYRDRHNAIRGERCRETGLWLISADVTGARGDRVSWGPTAVLDPEGNVVAQLPLDAPGLLIFDVPTETRSATISST